MRAGRGHPRAIPVAGGRSFLPATIVSREYPRHAGHWPCRGFARTAFARLMVRCAVGLRIGSAVAAGIAAFAGLAPPASGRRGGDGGRPSPPRGRRRTRSCCCAAGAVPGRSSPTPRWPAALGLAVGRLVPAAVPRRHHRLGVPLREHHGDHQPAVARTLVAAAAQYRGPGRVRRRADAGGHGRAAGRRGAAARPGRAGDRADDRAAPGRSGRRRRRPPAGGDRAAGRGAGRPAGRGARALPAAARQRVGPPHRGRRRDRRRLGQPAGPGPPRPRGDRAAERARAGGRPRPARLAARPVVAGRAVTVEAPIQPYRCRPRSALPSPARPPRR